MNPVFMCIVTEEQEQLDRRAAQLGRSIVKREGLRDKLSVDLKNGKKQRKKLCQMGLSSRYLDLAMVVLKNNYNKNEEMMSSLKNLYKEICQRRNCFNLLVAMMEEGE